MMIVLCVHLRLCFWKPPLEQGTDTNVLINLLPNMLLEISGEITPERMKTLGQSRNDAQFWMGLVVKIKSSAVKNNIA